MEHEQVAICAFWLAGLEGHQALRSAQAALSESRPRRQGLDRATTREASGSCGQLRVHVDGLDSSRGMKRLTAVACRGDDRSGLPEALSERELL
jgi:hypothetical protein